MNSGALRLPHFHGKHLFGGLQVFNTLIYTSKQHRKGIVLKGGTGLQKEGGQGNEGCFIFSFFPSGVGRALSLRGRHIDAIMIAFNQTHDQMEGFLLSRQKLGVSRQSGITAEVFVRLFTLKQIVQNPILCCFRFDKYTGGLTVSTMK